MFQVFVDGRDPGVSEGMTVAETEKWLAPILGYDPATADAA